MSGYLQVALTTGKEQPAPYRIGGRVGAIAALETVARTKLPPPLERWMFQNGVLRRIF
jgi:hypothetical protein